MKKIIVLFILFIFTLHVSAEELSITKNAKSSILIENSTGKILYENNIYEERSPASMTKIMTLLLTMEALDSNKISLDDEVLVSKNASSMGGTQIYLEQGTKITVENLIKGVCVASANDAAVALAEYIGGTLENFVLLMNKKAKELGCKNTNFENPHGLDSDNHYTTAYDLSLIARELLKHEEILNYTSIYEDHIVVSGKEQWLINTNKLIKFYDGVDGLKTGYTDKALYCLTATKEQNNMRLISIVMGEDSKENRTTDTVNLLEYGFSNYGIKEIFNNKDSLGKIYISNSSKRYINYYLKDNVNIVLNKDNKDIEYSTNIILNDVQAPLKKNSVIGTFELNVNDEVYSYDLIVKNNIKKSSYFEYIFNLFKDIITGRINIV